MSSITSLLGSSLNAYSLSGSSSGASLGSSLNSITQSLLSEISSAAAGSTSSTASGAASSIDSENAALYSSDQVNFSQSATLLQKLQQLQTSNPTEFAKVLTDGAAALNTAASESSDPTQASVLKTLASDFTTAASTGDLSSIRTGLFSTPVTSANTQNLFSYLQSNQSDSSSSTQDLLSSALSNSLLGSQIATS